MSIRLICSDIDGTLLQYGRKELEGEIYEQIRELHRRGILFCPASGRQYTSLHGSFTKTVCGAKNRNQLLKAKTIAEELGLVENRDFFLIRDACHTELEPEEFDENGEGMTLTCIGFRPLPDEIAHQISHKFHLY